MAENEREEWTLGPSTRAVHAGEPAVRDDRSLTVPIVHSSTYPFEHTAELVAFMSGEKDRTPEYGRYGNPTVAAAEARLAALEGGDNAVLLSSGMAAITTSLLARKPAVGETLPEDRAPAAPLPQLLRARRSDLD